MIRAATLVAVFIAGGAWLLAPRTVAAQENAPASRDAEAGMFGAEAPPTATPTPVSQLALESPATGEARQLSEESSSSRIGALLAATDRVFDIGGKLYMRAQYTLLDQEKPETHPFASPNLFDLYADARPNDYLRAYAAGRLNYDFTTAEGKRDYLGNEVEPLRAALGQLWLKASVERTVYFTFGRQPIKWGSGHFWNPTDFLNRQRLDPFAVFDERLGVGLLKVHFPIESLGWNFYAIGNFEEASSPDKIGGALRAEFLVWQMELALSAAARKDSPAMLGADFSLGVWWFDFRGEAALTHGESINFWRGSFDPARFEFPKSYQRGEEWIPRVTGGLELAVPYGDEDSLILGGEYFYNDAGYDDATLYPVLLQDGTFTPLYVGRHYAGAYLLLQAPGRWDDTAIILSGLGNLSDHSFLARFDYRVRVLTYLDINAFINVHFGDKGEFRFALDIPPLPGTALKNGLKINPPILDAGVGFLLKF